MKPFLDWSNVSNAERRDIVFEYRNKSYGAFSLRKNYQQTVLFALILSITVIVLVFITPLAISYFTKINFKKSIGISESVNLEEPPPIDKSTPPPPPVVPPPPIQQTIKFTPPKVVKDEEVEEPPPTQEEVKEAQVSTVTQEGEKNLIDLPPEQVADPDEGKVFTVVEEMPSFPGGEAKLLELLSHIQYPTLAREEGISGWVYLNFIIDKDGKIRDAKITKGIGGGCDEEALRVLLSLPDWKPGRQNGRAVAVRNNIRINFSLK
jgi:protein TonB